MQKISIKAIIVGNIADMLLTTLCLLPFTISAVHAIDTTGMSQAQASDALKQGLDNNATLAWAAPLIGSLCTMIAGYIAAWIADQYEILNGALSSILCIASGVYAIMAGTDAMPLLQHIIYIVLTPIMAGFGGFIRYRQVGR